MRIALVALVVVGCGSDGGTSQMDAPAQQADAFDMDGEGIPPFAVTSPTITEGGMIPLTHACTTKGGMNQSPQLVFEHVPLGTVSFAVVLTDLTNSLVHYTIYDVPRMNVDGLPANIDTGYSPTAVPGAHQAASYAGPRAYAGPCPPNAHMYQFKVYALSTATVPNSQMSTPKEMIVSAASGSNIGTATLTATFTP